jgi:hypothetical protein
VAILFKDLQKLVSARRGARRRNRRNNINNNHKPSFLNSFIGFNEIETMTGFAAYTGLSLGFEQT